MIIYSQRDPRWAGHALGWGPALGTIGEYGCLDTVDAMIATDCGHALNPGQLDELFTAQQVFVRESTGTYDLLPDDALARAFPGDFAVNSFAGWRGDLIKAAVPSPDTYAVLWISTAAVPTHFVLAFSPDGSLIADPWTGRVGPLAGYGGPAAVHKTILVTHVPSAAHQPTPPAPVPLPTPPPATPPSVPVPAPNPTPAPPPPAVPPAPVNPPLVSPAPLPPQEVPPVASNPPVPDVVPPEVPEPPVVAEQGVTTSEWKLVLGYLAQAAAVGTADLVNLVGQQLFHASVAIPGPQLQLIVDLEFAGGVAVIGYAVSRGIRKLGAR